MTPETLTVAAAAVRLYAESHPRPIHVTKTDAAKMLGGPALGGGGARRRAVDHRHPQRFVE